MVDQKTIDEYSRNNAQIKKLKERQDELRAKLISFLRKHECPDGGPFLIKLLEFGRSAFSWKNFAIKAARAAWGDEAKKEIARAQKKAGETPISELTVDINPDWRK